MSSDAAPAGGRRKLSRTESIIARRMVESGTTVPTFSVRVAIDMEQITELRQRLKARGAGVIVPSVNDVIVKACATALSEHPRLNGAYHDGELELHERVNVGVAVASRGSLLVPIVFDADRKSASQIAVETKAMIQRVRDGSISPGDLAGGTFTVSNLGMHGVDDFDAMINPPQAAIVAVGGVAARPVARDGQIEIRRTATLTLTCDHRIVYGAHAAKFLARLRDLLETEGAEWA